MARSSRVNSRVVAALACVFVCVVISTLGDTGVVREVRRRRPVAFALPQPEAGPGVFGHVPHRDLVGSALAQLAKPRDARETQEGSQELTEDARTEKKQRKVAARSRKRKSRATTSGQWLAHQGNEDQTPLNTEHALAIVHGYALVRRLRNFQPPTWPLAQQRLDSQVSGDMTMAPAMWRDRRGERQHVALSRRRTWLQQSSNPLSRGGALLRLPGGPALVAKRLRQPLEWCEWPRQERPVAHDGEQGATAATTRATMEGFELHDKFAAGSQGEVWEAFRVNSQGEKERFVLKRVLLERDASFALAGQREAVFGERLQDRPEVARFVEAFNFTEESISFTSEAQSRVGFWLVFRHEGESLDALLYSRIEASKVVLLEPSEFWHRMRRDALGAQVRREILRQVCEGLVALAEANVAHRDIKPSNLLLSELEISPSAKSWPFRVKLADFGSALDTEDGPLNARLYGAAGPTMHEETRWYRPPEAFLAAETSQRFPYMGNDLNGVEDASRPLPYHAFDMWSLGVVALEMLLGTAHIFQVSDRQRARLRAKLTQVSYLYSSPQAFEAALESRCAFAALQDFGIGPPPSTSEGHLDSAYDAAAAAAGMGSNRTKFRAMVRERDPLKTGFYFAHAGEFDSVEEMELYGDDELDFVWWLLQWSPFDRPTPEQALRHPFFGHFT